MTAKSKGEHRRAKSGSASEAKGKIALQLPAHWPRFVSPEYYSWMMARMPSGAIQADWSKHQAHNSYSPIFWYQDKSCVCADCGVQFVFTKEEQQVWYEEYHFPIYVRANRCAKCRALLRHEKEQQREHMKKMASRIPHPNEAFFKKKS